MRYGGFFVIGLGLGLGGALVACGATDPLEPGYVDVAGDGGAGASDEAPGPTEQTPAPTGTGAGTGTGPSATSGGWHPSSGASGVGNGAGTPGSGGGETGTGPSSNSTTSGGGEPPACEDAGPEPNESEAEAVVLGGSSDCDESTAEVQGTLSQDDVDWYKFGGSDDWGCFNYPARSINATSPVEFCKFFECANGAVPTIGCPDGSTAATSPDDRPGCCSTHGMEVELSCSTLNAWDDSATVFVRVRAAEPDAGCVQYRFDYNF